MRRSRSSLGLMVWLAMLLVWLAPLALRTWLIDAVAHFVWLDWAPNILPYWTTRWMQHCDQGIVHTVGFCAVIFAMPGPLVFWIMRKNGRLPYGADADSNACASPPVLAQTDGSDRSLPKSPISIVEDAPSVLPRRPARGCCGGRGCLDGFYKVIFGMAVVAVALLAYWATIVWKQALGDNGVGLTAAGFSTQAQANWWNDVVPLVEGISLLMLVEGWRVRMPMWCVFSFILLTMLVKGLGVILAVPLFIIQLRQHLRANDLAWWWCRTQARAVASSMDSATTDAHSVDAANVVGAPLPSLSLQSASSGLAPERTVSDICSIPSESPPLTPIDGCAAVKVPSHPDSGVAARSPSPREVQLAAIVQLSSEPLTEVDHHSSRVDMELIATTVRNFTDKPGFTTALAHDLLLHPSPLNSRLLGNITVYGLNLPLELLVAFYHLWLVANRTYIWMAWIVQHEENACWLTVHQEEMHAVPAAHMMGLVPIFLFLPLMTFEMSFLRFFNHAADTEAQPMLGLVLAMLVGYFNNINIAMVLGLAFGLRELFLSFGDKILNIFHESIATGSARPPPGEVLLRGPQSVWWSSRAPSEYCREENGQDNETSASVSVATAAALSVSASSFNRSVFGFPTEMKSSAESSTNVHPDSTRANGSAAMHSPFSVSLPNFGIHQRQHRSRPHCVSVPLERPASRSPAQSVDFPSEQLLGTWPLASPSPSTGSSSSSSPTEGSVLEALDGASAMKPGEYDQLFDRLHVATDYANNLAHALAWLCVRVIMFCGNEMLGSFLEFFAGMSRAVSSAWRRWQRFMLWGAVDLPQAAVSVVSLSEWCTVLFSIAVHYYAMCLFVSLLLWCLHGNHDLVWRFVLEQACLVLAFWIAYCEQRNLAQDAAVDGVAPAPKSQAMAMDAIPIIGGSSPPSPKSPRPLQVVGDLACRQPVCFVLLFAVYLLCYMLCARRLDHDNVGLNASYFHFRISLLNLIWRFQKQHWNVAIVVLTCVAVVAMRYDCPWTRVTGVDAGTSQPARSKRGVKQPQQVTSHSLRLSWFRTVLFALPLVLVLVFVWPSVVQPCTLQPGVEFPRLTEQQLDAHFVSTDKIIRARAWLNGTSEHPSSPQRRPALRGAHSKQHGCVKARFSLPYFIPQKYRHGIFSANVPAGLYNASGSNTASFDADRSDVKQWTAFVRFSNGRPAQWDGRGEWMFPPDSSSDVRGMSVKVLLNPSTPLAMSLSPEERSQHHTDSNTQDFIAITSDHFFTRSPEHLAELTRVATSRKPVRSMLRWIRPKEWSWDAFQTSWSKLKVAVRGVFGIGLMNQDGARMLNPLRGTYFSAVPFRLGPELREATERSGPALAVKYKWAPCTESLETHQKKIMIQRHALGMLAIRVANGINWMFQGITGATGRLIPVSTPYTISTHEAKVRDQQPDGFLRINMQNALHPDFNITQSGGPGVCMQLLLQEQGDACQNQIEDASTPWQGGWTPVARLDIEPQLFLHSSALAVCENLSFNPWHALAAHRPMGDINRVRKMAYLQSSKLRRELNAQNPIGPVFTGSELPVLMASEQIIGAPAAAIMVAADTTQYHETDSTVVAAIRPAAFSALEVTALYGDPATYEFSAYPSPWSGLPKLIRHLPRNETFSHHMETLITHNTLHTITVPTAPQPRFRADMTKLQHFEEVALGRAHEAVIGGNSNRLVSGRMRRPEHVDEHIWTTDAFFADQFIRGLNPMKIVRVTSNTPLTSRLRALNEQQQHQVEQVLQGQGARSIVELSDQHRLFFADYPELNNITTVKATVLYSPVVLFYLAAVAHPAQRQLLPLLIQLEDVILCRAQDAGSCQPHYPSVYFPAAWDPSLPAATHHHPIVKTQTPESLAWLFAKMHVASADAQSHQLISHLLETHLVLESTLIATHRALSTKHVVHRLLRPHFTGTLAINDFGRMTLVSFLEPFVDSFQSVGLTGAMELMTRRYQSSEFVYMEPLPAQLARRGFEVSPPPASQFNSTPDLSGFLYRDYGLPLFYLLHNYVEEVLATESRYAATCSASDKLTAMDSDVQLQAWFRELFSVDGADLPLRGRIHPGVSFADLVDFLTQVIFQATAQHAAVNFPQYEWLSFSPIRPLSLSKSMPRDLSELSERYMIDALVDDSGLQILHTTYNILSAWGVNTLMGDESAAIRNDLLDTSRTIEPTFPELWDRLRHNMQALQQKETAHNERHSYSYPYLYPDRIPFSTAI